MATAAFFHVLLFIFKLGFLGVTTVSAQLCDWTTLDRAQGLANVSVSCASSQDTEGSAGLTVALDTNLPAAPLTLPES